VAVPDAEDNDTVRQAGFVCVGSFDAKAESKVFAVPGSVNLEKYRAVTIWSRRYQVNFTTAPLQ
jgi:hypothetical protein